MEPKMAKEGAHQSLGEYLRALRARDGYALRAVEDATKISNAYLSQLENDKITKPSPHILHTLAEFYGVPYDVLMEKAGYIKRAAAEPSSRRRSGRLAASALGELTREEEEELLKYLGYIRQNRHEHR